MQREILCVVQPCILCEGDIGVMTIFRDDETGKEVIETEWADHRCEQMQALIQERRQTAWPPYKKFSV